MRLKLHYKEAYTIVSESYFTAFKYNIISYYAERYGDYLTGTQQALKYIKRNI